MALFIFAMADHNMQWIVLRLNAPPLKLIIDVDGVVGTVVTFVWPQGIRLQG